MKNFSPTTEKAIARFQAVERGPAWKRATAFVIIPSTGLLGPRTDGDILAGGRRLPHGKIKVAYPADGAGRLEVFVWDCIGTDIQYGSASGGNYDKLAHALKGLTFDGVVTFADHGDDWRAQLERMGYTVIQAI